MNLNELQEESEEIISKIDTRLGIIHDDSLVMNHLIEEMGEIARQINNKNIRKISVDKENLKEEIADVLLLLTRIANNNQINLEEAVKNKIEKLRQRHNLV